MNMIDKVRATDPYPPSRVALDLDAEGRELMEEIMTPKKTLLSRYPLRRHGRWLVPVAAAAAVAALVAGGIVIRGGDDGADPSNTGPASSGKANPKPGLEKPAQPKKPKSDPGLPPTAENLHHVVLNDDEWQVSNLHNDSANGGALWWQNGDSKLQLTWYPASDYQAYLADRRNTGPAKDATVLGQQGESFRQTVDLEKSSGDQTIYVSPTGGPEGMDEAAGDNVRVTTILPPVGDFYLEFDAFVADTAEYDALMAALSRVDGVAWNTAIDRATVTAAEGQAFLNQARRGVPLPQGMTVTVADLKLPQSEYQARASFTSKVLCGWTERYVDGDDAALDALQGSSGWAVLKAMDDGDFPEATENLVEELAADRTFPHWRAGWGCS